MDTPVTITKKALIAEMNRIRAARPIVDTEYEPVNDPARLGAARLILIYADGQRVPFRGLNAV